MDDAVPLRQPLIEPPAVINVAEVDPAALTLPLDPYELSPQELFTISRARLTLLLDCLRNRGIQISTPEARPIPWSRHEQRYGLTDLDRAARFGYRGLPPDLGHGVYAAWISVAGAARMLLS
jgi:hypothetical protein